MSETSTKISELRRDYKMKSLDLDTSPADPFEMFRGWFDEAVAGEILEPNAMVLGTVNSSGQPSQRTVLLKAFDDQGFVFYTNYTSKKAREIAENSQVSMLFPWYALERQVRIEGMATKISTVESLKYFASRPLGSRLGAWVSNQSSVISSRSILEMKLAELKEKFKNGEVPLPDFWGGYKVEPTLFEFWQGRQSRLHDRIEYLRKGADWSRHRLAP